MAELVFAAATAHAALMVRATHLIEPRQRDAIYGGFKNLSQRLEAARPDVIVMFGADHFSTFFLGNMPSFCIGIGGRAQTWGDGGIPVYDLQVHGGLAKHILESVLEDGVDVAFSNEMMLDHGFACPLHFLTPKMQVPVVPIFINCAAPPLPPLKRCYALGEAVGRAIAAFPELLRVAVLGTGGLSHWVPIPRFDSPKDDVDREMIGYMSKGESEKLRALLRKRVDQWAEQGRGTVGEDFDRKILSAFSAGDANSLTGWTADWIDEQGGNGGQELRTWMAAAAAADNPTGDVVLYEPVPRWLTGIGMFEWHIAGRRHEATRPAFPAAASLS